MTKLIPEIASPNVTFNDPMAFSRLSTISTGYTCKVVDGVYIFDMDDEFSNGKFWEAMNIAFAAYSGHMYPVNVTGLAVGSDDPVGSTRFCTMSAHLATFFTAAIRESGMLDCYPLTYSDALEFVQVSRYFRAMRYKAGGEHFPHYDSDFNLPMIGAHLGQRHVTKMSLVAYGDNCETGKIAFLRASTGPEFGKGDWNRQATRSEISSMVEPRVGRFVVFDHDRCHTVLPYSESGERRILRGDLIFKN